MNILQHRNIFFSISGLLVLGSIIAVILFGLPYGIDFTGGSLLEVRYAEDPPAMSEIHDLLSEYEYTGVQVQSSGETGFLLRSQPLSEDQHQEILGLLEQAAGENGTAVLEEIRFESIGPAIGTELKQKAIYALFLAIIFIVLYIAWAFRKVSKPVRSWQYGVVAIVALVHDVTIPIGIFAILGSKIGYEINTAFIAAILTILGYSVNDTIIVFDRIRENLLRRRSENFETVVNDSVRQTLTRSINTSLTTLLVLLTLFFFGGATIKGFVLALIIGVIAGGYSSIFLASPLLVILEKRLRR